MNRPSLSDNPEVDTTIALFKGKEQWQSEKWII